MPDTKITALAAITVVDPAVDVFPIVDVSDTSMAASGTTKKITSNQLLGAGGTATFASATITGDLTAARLIVTGGTIPTNGLWLPTTNTLEFATNSLAQYRIAPLGVFTWFDGAGGTRMTLNSTGLGVGVTPSAWGVSWRGLEVSSVLGLMGGSATSILTHNMYANAAAQLIYKTTNFASYYQQQNGIHSWLTAPSGTAGNVATFTQAMTLDASGRLILLASTTTPATLTTNGEFTMTATSNTNLRFSYRGSDGTTRVANITLA
jgi:hypothetical protein